VVGVNQRDSSVDSPCADRVASVKETMRVALILPKRDEEMLRRQT
jgi:hypothetical protein